MPLVGDARVAEIASLKHNKIKVLTGEFKIYWKITEIKIF